VHHDAYIVHRPHPFGKAANGALKLMWENNAKWCDPLLALHSYPQLRGADNNHDSESTCLQPKHCYKNMNQIQRLALARQTGLIVWS